MILIFKKLLIFLFFILYSCVLATPWPFQRISFSRSRPHQFFINTVRLSKTCFDAQNVQTIGKKGYLLSRRMLKKNRHDCNVLFDSNETAALWHTIAQCVNCSVEQSLLEVDKNYISLIVRVLLSHADGKQPVDWKFHTENGFLVSVSDDKEGKKKPRRYKEVVLTTKKGMLFCNGKKINDFVRVKSVSGHMHFNGVAYDGDFVIAARNDSFLCINHVPLEEYIASVLRTESWPGWPLEVNKVFAIACRSYVAAQVLEAQKVKRPYHVKNTNEHQTYRGRHEVSLLKQAVESTRGVVLGFESKPILAMFDCCCGGVVPAHIADFDFGKAPYLARTYACNYCSACSLYSWTVDYEHSYFQDLFKKNYKDLRVLRDIVVTKKDRAGLVSEVKVADHKTHMTISGKKLYSLLKEVKSFHFDVAKKANKIIFTGRGFGHHLGLCQWGARQMVRDGFDYKAILKFYYPDTYFMKLT